MEEEIDVKQLWNMDGLNRLLSVLMKRCSDQMASLKKVESQLATRAARTELDRTKDALGTRIRGNEERLNACLHRIALVPKESVNEEDFQSQNIGRVVSWQLTRLAQIDMILKRKADMDDLARVHQNVNEAVKEVERRVTLERASAKQVKVIRETQQTLVQQFQVLEQLVSSKLDRTELAYMQDVASRIEDFSKFHDDIMDELNASKEKVLKLSKENVDSQNRINALEKKLVKLENAATQAASQSDLEALAKIVIAVQQSAEQGASKEDVQLLHDKTVNNTKKLNSLLETFNTQFKQEVVQRNKHDSILSQKADIAAVKEKASLAFCNEMFDKILKQLEAKADKAVVSEMATTSQQQQMMLERKTELALRFLDWFSERGEAFEHNFRLVEDNLTKLSKRSTPNLFLGRQNQSAS